MQPTVGINNFKASACFRINNEYLGSNNDAYYLIKGFPLQIFKGDQIKDEDLDMIGDVFGTS